MAFTDLPADWPDEPIEGVQRTNDVLDLMVSLRARYTGALIILLCDEHHRLFQPVAIDDLEDCHRPADLREPLRLMAQAIQEVRPGTTALVAIARPGALTVTGKDRAWAGLLQESFGDLVEIIGIHVVTPRGFAEVPERRDAA